MTSLQKGMDPLSMMASQARMQKKDEQSKQDDGQTGEKKRPSVIDEMQAID